MSPCLDCSADLNLCISVPLACYGKMVRVTQSRGLRIQWRHLVSCWFLLYRTCYGQLVNGSLDSRPITQFAMCDPFGGPSGVWCVQGSPLLVSWRFLSGLWQVLSIHGFTDVLTRSAAWDAQLDCMLILFGLLSWQATYRHRASSFIGQRILFSKPRYREVLRSALQHACWPLIQILTSLDARILA